MAIGGDYPSPVLVNGYSCKNCTDVDNAKKHIDPAHPKDGPYGVDAKTGSHAAEAPAVKFGGRLAALVSAQSSTSVAHSTRAPAVAQGQRLDISA